MSIFFFSCELSPSSLTHSSSETCFMRLNLKHTAVKTGKEMHVCRYVTSLRGTSSSREWILLKWIRNTRLKGKRTRNDRWKICCQDGNYLLLYTIIIYIYHLRQERNSVHVWAFVSDIYACWGFPPPSVCYCIFFYLYKSPWQRELLTPRENTAPAAPETLYW